jgi:hypothetical protein
MNLPHISRGVETKYLATYGKVAYLELSFYQISETVIRLIVRTNIAPRSQRLVLINQRGRHILSPKMLTICVSMCSLSACCLWMLTDAIPVSTYTRTHTPSLSLCLSATLPFSLPFKRCCDTGLMINRNTDFSQLSSYHFKGSTYTKYSSSEFLNFLNLFKTVSSFSLLCLDTELFRLEVESCGELARIGTLS